MDKTDIDSRYLIRPYYIRPDGKVGHDAFAVIREMNKIATGRVALTSREHTIALEPMDKGLVGTLLHYPYEVSERERVSRRDAGREASEEHARCCSAHREPEGCRL